LLEAPSVSVGEASTSVSLPTVAGLLSVSSPSSSSQPQRRNGLNGGPAVQVLESYYRSKWRTPSYDRKLFSRRLWYTSITCAKSILMWSVLWIKTVGHECIINSNILLASIHVRTVKECPSNNLKAGNIRTSAFYWFCRNKNLHDKWLELGLSSSKVFSTARDKAEQLFDDDTKLVMFFCGLVSLNGCVLFAIKSNAVTRTLAAVRIVITDAG
jgi:hypothetical protein